MILGPLSHVYGAIASWRRRRYATDPRRVRTLSQPVISVGNLSTGGSGKTPVVAHLARLLLESGERPAILTRGYARRSPVDGVTVVSDRWSVIKGIDASGDEPLMLARALPGVPVLVGTDRYLSGRLAETRFEVTVHLLDDGFQHLALERDVDLLLVDNDDLHDRLLPAGRLRERLAAAVVADAVLDSRPGSAVVRDGRGEPGAIAEVLQVSTGFSVVRRIKGPPEGFRGTPVFAVAGLARPERFFADLSASGWSVVATRAFRDHHPFTRADVDRIAADARAAGAKLVVTTEKDAIRFDPRDLTRLRLWPVPLTVEIEPAAVFRDWLLERLRAARSVPRHRAADRGADRQASRRTRGNAVRPAPGR